MLQVKLLGVSVSLLVLSTVTASGTVRLLPTDSGIVWSNNRLDDLDPSSYQIWAHTQFYFQAEPETSERGFLYFDLTSVTDPVKAATLRLKVADLQDPRPSPTIARVNLYDVTTTAAASPRERFIDYGSGVLYGSRLLRDDQDLGAVVELDLDPTAVANINSASEPFGIGVEGVVNVHAWLVTSDHELILDTSPEPIPEPQSLIIFAAYTCLGLLAWRRWKSC